MADGTGKAMRLPVLRGLPGPSGRDVRGDVLGALTAWALIVPECVAYAQIAGVPPQNAFYAALAAPEAPTRQE